MKEKKQKRKCTKMQRSKRKKNGEDKRCDDTKGIVYDEIMFRVKE